MYFYTATVFRNKELSLGDLTNHLREPVGFYRIRSCESVFLHEVHTAQCSSVLLTYVCY